MKHGFKVLSRENRKLMSFTLAIGRVRYITGRPARPKPGNGPLAVFKTEADARDFANAQLRELTIYTIFPYYTIFPCTYKPSRVSRLWSIDKYGFRSQRRGDFPDGTDFATTVILQRRRTSTS